MALGTYTDRLKKRGSHEPSFCYLMDTLLQSRIATCHESNRDYFDEDVSVYLALLLNSMVTNRFHRKASHYIAPTNSDLPEIVERAGNAWAKHEVYRTNGDFLLLQTGIFHVPDDDREKRWDLASATERGSAYYRYACSFAGRIPERYAQVTEVLAKLSRDFEKYRQILSYMRGEFLNLVKPISSGDVNRIYDDIQEFEREKRISVCQDELLDAYLDYQKANSRENRERIEARLAELQEIDPRAWKNLEISIG